MICRARNRLIYGARSWLICRTGSWLICRAGSRLICRARSRWVCSVRHRGAFTLQPPFSPRTLAPARSRPPAPRPRGSHGAGASSPGGSAGGRAGPGAGGHRTRRGETGQEEGKQCGEEKQVYIFSRASGSSPPCSWGGAGREGKRRHRREVLSPGAEHGPRPPSPACREQPRRPHVRPQLPRGEAAEASERPPALPPAPAGPGRCCGAGCVRESRSVAAPGGSCGVRSERCRAAGDGAKPVGSRERGGKAQGRGCEPEPCRAPWRKQGLRNTQGVEASP